MDHSDDRHFSLDALRGFAVMGILFMNILAFAMPMQAYINPIVWGGTAPADLAAWFVAFVAVDGKMRGLFSLMFGASALLVMDRAEMSGRNGMKAQLSRLFWLFPLGFAHYVLIWWGDILMLYALVGLLAMAFARKEPMTLVKWAFLAFLAHFLLCMLLVLSQQHGAAVALAPGATPAELKHYSTMLDHLGAPGSRDVAEQLRVYRGDYDGMVAHRIAGIGELFKMAILNGFDTLGFMLLGMAMLKGGFLTGSWPADQYLRTFRHCFLIGFPPMVLLAALVMASGFAPVTTLGHALAWSFPFRIPLTVGYAALALWLVARHRDHWLVARVAATGRAALSNYIGTSLLMTGIFYGYGLGLFGHVDRAPLYLFVAGAWTLMLLWSKPWLDRLRYGPMEWLWRSLARGRPQAMRRSVPA